MRQDFSIFESVQSALKANRIAPESSVALNQNEARPGVTSRFTGTTQDLLAWCSNVEHTVINRKLPRAQVFAGFERFSRARFVARRYEKLGAVAEELHLVGQPDWEIPFPTTCTHPVTDGPLLREWFLIVSSERFVGLLSARDLDGLETQISPRKRRFEGVITHNPRTIRDVIEAFREASEVG